LCPPARDKNPPLADAATRRFSQRNPESRVFVDSYVRPVSPSSEAFLQRRLRHEVVIDA
jgi:hypothetical protein